MKRLSILCLIGMLCACNAGEHKPDTNLKDSTQHNSDYPSGAPYSDPTDSVYNTDTVKTKATPQSSQQ